MDLVFIRLPDQELPTAGQRKVWRIPTFGGDVYVSISAEAPPAGFVAGYMYAQTLTKLSEAQEGVLRALGVVEPRVGQIDVPSPLWDRFKAHLEKLGAS